MAAGGAWTWLSQVGVQKSKLAILVGRDIEPGRILALGRPRLGLRLLIKLITYY